MFNDEGDVIPEINKVIIKIKDGLSSATTSSNNIDIISYLNSMINVDDFGNKQIINNTIDISLTLNNNLFILQENINTNLESIY